MRHFLIAVQFLTRLPVPRRLVTTEAELGKAAAFFPLVGVIVGGSAAAVFVLTSRVVPSSVAVLLTLGFTTLLTNAFHEDGLADTFDGLGGGWTRDRALEIMRDSRIGTYGALALIFLILGKYTFLNAVEPRLVWRLLIVAHTASRWTILPLCMWLPYARSEGQGKLVAKQIGFLSALAGTLTFLVTLLLLPRLIALITLVAITIVVLFCGLYFKRRLGGITGDCLGAVNQLTEVVVYLIALLLRFT